MEIDIIHLGKKDYVICDAKTNAIICTAEFSYDLENDKITEFLENMKIYYSQQNILETKNGT